MSSPPPLPPRRSSPSPGAYAHAPGADSQPTNPGTPAATEARRRISYQAQNEEEIRALEGIVKAWLRMGNEDRVLVAALCRRLDPLP